MLGVYNLLTPSLRYDVPVNPSRRPIVGVPLPYESVPEAACRRQILGCDEWRYLVVCLAASERRRDQLSIQNDYTLLLQLASTEPTIDRKSD